jgi:hypothetical protein
MTRQRTKTLKILTGTGKVYQGDEEIATVRYSLTIDESNQKIQGQITMVQGEYDLNSDDTLILHLEDGRRQFDFVPTSSTGRPPVVTYKILPAAGGRGLILVD